MTEIIARRRQDGKNRGLFSLPLVFYEGANLAFYGGHVESRHKSKVWIPQHAQQKPYQPGMWVVSRDLWKKNGGGL
jgi:prepilin-type processing-associated H-X9-DG protein